jgi:hypothetical protein
MDEAVLDPPIHLLLIPNESLPVNRVALFRRKCVYYVDGSFLRVGVVPVFFSNEVLRLPLDDLKFQLRLKVFLKRCLCVYPVFVEHSAQSQILAVNPITGPTSSASTVNTPTVTVASRPLHSKPLGRGMMHYERAAS